MAPFSLPGQYGGDEHRRELLGRGFDRAVLVYNNSLGIGYTRWRDFALCLAREVWTYAPDGTLARLDRDRARAEDWRETIETIGRGWCRMATRPLLALAQGWWRLLGARELPDPAAMAALARITGGNCAVSRFIRTLHIMRALGAPTGSLMDIGTGDGLLLRLLAELPRSGELRLAGVDRNIPPALARWAEAASAAVEQTDITADWQPRGVFTHVVICEVLEHISDDAAALRRWLGPLPRDARVIIHVPCRDERLLPGDIPQADHVRPGYTEEELRTLAASAGLRVLAVQRTFHAATARCCWLDRRLASRPLLQHLLRPLLLALALPDAAGDDGDYCGLLLAAVRR